MKLRYLLFYLLVSVFCTITSNAQSTGILKGTAVENSMAVPFANVLLYSQADTLKIQKLALTDTLGKFEIADVPYGSYVIKIQMLGYLPTKISCVLNMDVLKVAPIQLFPDNKLLQSIEIISQRDLIKKTAQGFIINTKDNLTQAGGTATDLLRNTPTLVVDVDGNITVRGKSPLILINGRNSVLSATDLIPASSVESIEIINNPSAQYDADADGGIISIKLKKNTAKGTNGSVALGAGYGAKGRANCAFIINHQAGKWNVGLAYDNRFAGRTRKADSYRDNFNLPDQYYLTQIRHDNRNEGTHNVKVNVDYNPNSKNTLGLEAIGNIGNEDNYETLVSMIKNQNQIFQTKNSRFSAEHVREKSMEYALNYSHKFDNPRKSLTALASTSFNFDKEDTDINTQSLNEDDSHLGSAYLQRTSNHQNSNVSNFKVDYVHPIGAKAKLETGAKSIIRSTDADFQSQYNVNNVYVSNPLASNVFNFKEQVHAAYVQYRSYKGTPDSAKWKYDIGVRGEQVFNHGYGVTNNLTVKRNYFNVFPTANLAYFINPSDFIKISFSRRINRPGLGQLNPFVDITDSLNQHGGNPYLKPELINAFETGYNKEWKRVSLTANVFYRYATNIIRQYIFLKSNGVAITQPTNYGSGTTYGFESIITMFPTKWWSVNTSVSLFQQKIDGSNVSPDLSNNVLSWYGKVINNFTVWKNGKLQVLGNYNSPIATPQGTKIAVYNVDMGFQQKLFKGKAALNMVVTDVFNTQKKGQNANAPDFSYGRVFKIDTRAIIVTFAYSFGTAFKEDLLENKFSNE